MKLTWDDLKNYNDFNIEVYAKDDSTKLTFDITHQKLKSLIIVLQRFNEWNVEGLSRVDMYELLDHLRSIDKAVIEFKRKGLA